MLSDSDYKKIKTGGCCGGACNNKTVVSTPHGEMIVKSSAPLDQQHLQEKIDNAIKIEIDGCGKVVEYDDPHADLREETYKTITAKKKLSIWARIVAFINRLTMIRSKPIPIERKAPDPSAAKKHVIKRAE